MKWQIFIPILLLQFVNLFWYFLILRILFRSVASPGEVELEIDGRSAVFTTEAVADDRSDDEDDEPSTQEKVNKLKNGKAQ